MSWNGALSELKSAFGVGKEIGRWWPKNSSAKHKKPTYAPANKKGLAPSPVPGTTHFIHRMYVVSGVLPSLSRAATIRKIIHK